MKYAAIALACCLLLTACGSGTAGSKAKRASAFKPTLNVSLEVEGNTLEVTVDTDLAISPEHYGMARSDGEGHIHMYLDNGEKIGVKERVYRFEDLASGRHTVKVSLHNNDHTPYDVTTTKEFDIP